MSQDKLPQPASAGRAVRNNGTDIKATSIGMRHSSRSLTILGLLSLSISMLHLMRKYLFYTHFSNSSIFPAKILIHEILCFLFHHETNVPLVLMTEIESSNQLPIA